MKRRGVSVAKASFEADVLDIIESAYGSITPGELYKSLKALGYDEAQATLRKWLGALSSVEQIGPRKPWTLVEFTQGESEDRHRELTVSMVPSPPAESVVPRSDRTLPIERLSWEDFELLCVYMLDEFCTRGTVQPYGRRGQNQLGIDVLGVNKSTGKYDVVQCKRYESAPFGVLELEQAVDRFMQGSWKTNAQRLILAITKDMDDVKLTDEFVAQERRLATEGVEFLIWDTGRITRILQARVPHLIEAFFGSEWAAAMGCVGACRRVHFLDATSVLDGTPSNSSLEAFDLAALKQRTKRVGSSQANAGLCDVDDMEPLSWETARVQMERTVRPRLGIWRQDEPDAGVAVFPLARVSLLFCLGQTLGDRIQVDLYRWERDRHTWCWDAVDDGLTFEFGVITPELESPKHVGVLVSITSMIHEDDVRRSVKQHLGDADIELWRIHIVGGVCERNNIHHPEQVRRFQKTWRALQQKLEERYGFDIELHVFISASAPIAVSMGQALLTRARPRLINLYELCGGTHHKVLTV